MAQNVRWNDLRFKLTDHVYDILFMNVFTKYVIGTVVNVGGLWCYLYGQGLALLRELALFDEISPCRSYPLANPFHLFDRTASSPR